MDVLGFFEIITIIIQVILNPRETHHKYSVFRDVSLNSHHASALRKKSIQYPCRFLTHVISCPELLAWCARKPCSICFLRNSLV